MPSNIGEEVEIIIAVYDATDLNPHHNQAYGKQQFSAFSKPSGMMYSPSSGIWDTIWLECVTPRYIDDVYIRPDIDAGHIIVNVTAAGTATGTMEADSETVTLAVMENGKTVASGTGAAGSPITIKMPSDAAHWCPRSPFLYNLSATLGSVDSAVEGFPSEAVDIVTVYFGYRKVSVGINPETKLYSVMLNNKPFYQLGTLDQGWFPDGLYAAPTDEALQSDLVAMKAMGFNAIRKHMKVDTRRWFAHCDRMGFLVWQDIPQQNMDFDRFKEEIGEWLIVMWCGRREFYPLSLAVIDALSAQSRTGVHTATPLHSSNGRHTTKVGVRVTLHSQTILSLISAASSKASGC
jgi:beta-galactosidase/beta-glucuronidase